MRLERVTDFGGVITAAREDGTTVIAFVSPAPLLRHGGHSQGCDLGAQSAGAFFARLMAVAGRDRSFDMAATQADPVTLYAAFIADQLKRRPTLVDIDLDPVQRQMFLAEASRLRRFEASRWDAGQRLAAVLRSGWPG